MRLFTHLVRLKGKKGIVTNIMGLFDGGAMVNSICKAVYTMKDHLGDLLPSSCTLRMADGTHIPLAGRWAGDVHLKSQVGNLSIEVFPSGGRWSLLFGKPLLEKFRAIHDYGKDTVHLPKSDRGQDILANSQVTTPEAEANTVNSSKIHNLPPKPPTTNQGKSKHSRKGRHGRRSRNKKRKDNMKDTG